MAPSNRNCQHRGSGGQVVPMFAAVVVLLALGALGLATAGRLAVDASRAQAAADAAALVAAPAADHALARHLAEQVAKRNGATVIAVEFHEGDAIVRVRLGRATATARARALPVAAEAVP